MAGFTGIAVGVAYHSLKPVVEFMTFNFSMQHLGKYFKQSAKGLEQQIAREAKFYGSLIRRRWTTVLGDIKRVIDGNAKESKETKQKMTQSRSDMMIRRNMVNESSTCKIFKSWTLCRCSIVISTHP
ncbi:hypothetical protein POM88_003420 [Heracleum sosnowskyi]|uniref:Uncharacterized protein n=1 Tax=Heracleum sosnowskyi TaxID=360622 RepID=A0AAD8N6V1_9APIA|nr:hypothetical protein POM88_003420 [Heracleum sosnowskyi]